jgi:hypothetical protein
MYFSLNPTDSHSILVLVPISTHPTVYTRTVNIPSPSVCHVCGMWCQVTGGGISADRACSSSLQANRYTDFSLSGCESLVAETLGFNIGEFKGKLGCHISKDSGTVLAIPNSIFRYCIGVHYRPIRRYWVSLSVRILSCWNLYRITLGFNIDYSKGKL